jgi:4,5:9,10-diseco-3-hydroxy-5,9,17-trioxoandrosta-1(10),2-diene-4-oate hydrolase
MPIYTTLNGHKLTYTTAGHPDAPPLLMVHGWLSYRGVWRQTIEACQETHYCIAVDLLGFGQSDKPKEADYSVQAQGQRILQLANTLGFDRFALIGHSLGGQIALCLASMLAPERITKLVDVAGVVSARLMPSIERINYKWIALAAVFPRLYSLSRWSAHYRWGARSGFNTWFYDIEAIPFDEWAVDREMALQPSMHISAYKTGQAIHNLNLRAHLARITAPTLAIFGRQDAVVPVSDGHLVEQHVPNSRLALIDQCGHFPMYERTQQYLDALRLFLQDGYQLKPRHL